MADTPEYDRSGDFTLDEVRNQCRQLIGAEYDRDERRVLVSISALYAIAKPG